MFAQCQRDAYQRTLNAEVLACVERDGHYLATLTDTVLYPEGGGQPSDLGTVNGVSVTGVKTHPDGGFLHALVGPVDLGPTELAVDWSRRYDHMQQHTAQHLVTAIAADRFAMATVGFHLGSEVSTIDLQSPSLSPRDLDSLEETANAEVRKARTVSVRFVEPRELTELDVRTRGLPEGHTGTIRLVEIHGLDVNTCGGTHVRSTAEIQIVTFLDTEKMRGLVRLSYVAGERARTRWAQSRGREREVTRLLQCGADDHVAGLEKVIAARNLAERSNRHLEEQLADLLGEQLAASSEPFAALHRDDADFGFLNRITRAALDRRPDLLLLLTAGPSQDGRKNRAGLFLLAGPPDIVKELGPVVAEVVEGRGGGSPGRFQGKATRLENTEDALEFLRVRSCR